MANVVIDWRDVLAGRIRNIQATYPEAHRALLNWGEWSSDRRGIFPTMKPPSVWRNFKQSEAGDWGDEKPQAERVVIPFPVKPEPREREPYDEKTAYALDERIHQSGEVGVEWRRVIRIAYVTHDLPEDQFPNACGCSQDAFCERLETALRFVARFI